MLLFTPAGLSITGAMDVAPMSNSRGIPVQASTFLTHYVGRGVIDEDRRYAVGRLRAMSSGKVRRWPGEVVGALPAPRYAITPSISSHDIPLSCSLPYRSAIE